MAIDVVAQKLAQANTIKRQIREQANTKDVNIPEDAPFADYPGYIGAIPGHLQAKTLTPTTEGFTALPDEEYQGFSEVTLPAEPNLVPKKIAKGFSIFGVTGSAEIPEFDVADFFAGTLTNLTFDSATALRAYALYQYLNLRQVRMGELRTMGNYALNGCTNITSVDFPSLESIGDNAMYNFRSCVPEEAVTTAVEWDGDMDGLPSALGYYYRVSDNTYYSGNAKAIFSDNTEVEGAFISASEAGMPLENLYLLPDTEHTYAAVIVAKNMTIPGAIMEAMGFDNEPLALQAGTYFWGCSANHVARLELSKRAIVASTVGSYGCYYMGNTAATGFNYCPKVAANVGTYAFQYARLLSIEGKFTAVGTHAFSYLPALTKLHAEINGVLNTYGFAYNYFVDDFDISKSHITTLGTYAFFGLGSSRSNPATNRLVFDLRKSTSLTTVDQYAFGGNSSYPMRYVDVWLPASVTTINAGAFAYHNYGRLYMASETPPTLSASTCWTGASNHKIFVPHMAVHAYKAATYWSAQAANIVGYAAPGTFAVGASLPANDAAGYALTWYSDESCTTEVTEITDPNVPLYCLGGDRVAYVISANDFDNAYLRITDNEDVVYNGTPAFIPVDRTSITVELITAGEYGYKAKIGSTVIQFPYEVETLNTDLNFNCIIFDNNMNADFATATWAEIQKVSLAGLTADLYGDQVGTTRTVRLKNNTTVTLRLANATSDMYELADGSGTTGLVLEFVELWPSTYYMNSSNTNSGGWNSSYMRNTVMPLIWAQIPDDLKDVIATVKIKGSYSGSSSTINTSNDTLFLPAEREIFASRSHSRTEEWNALQRWQWYAQNDTAANRIKKRNGSATTWWLRSPYSGSSYGFVIVGTSGSASYTSANLTYGVAPGFCI